METPQIAQISQSKRKSGLMNQMVLSEFTLEVYKQPFKSTHSENVATNATKCSTFEVLYSKSTQMITTAVLDVL